MEGNRELVYLLAKVAFAKHAAPAQTMVEQFKNMTPPGGGPIPRTLNQFPGWQNAPQAPAAPPATGGPGPVSMGPKPPGGPVPGPTMTAPGGAPPAAPAAPPAAPAGGGGGWMSKLKGFLRGGADMASNAASGARNMASSAWQGIKAAPGAIARGIGGALPGLGGMLAGEGMGAGAEAMGGSGLGTLGRVASGVGGLVGGAVGGPGGAAAGAALPGLPALGGAALGNWMGQGSQQAELGPRAKAMMEAGAGKGPGLLGPGKNFGQGGPLEGSRSGSLPSPVTTPKRTMDAPPVTPQGDQGPLRYDAAKNQFFMRQGPGYKAGPQWGAQQGGGETALSTADVYRMLRGGQTQNQARDMGFKGQVPQQQFSDDIIQKFLAGDPSRARKWRAMGG